MSEKQVKRCGSYFSSCINNQCEIVKILEGNGETQIEERPKLLGLWIIIAIGIIALVILFRIIGGTRKNQ